MNAIVQAPLEMIEAIAALRLPLRSDRRLQELMELNNEGQLTERGWKELEDWVELSESLSLVRAQARQLLEGNKP